MLLRSLGSRYGVGLRTATMVNTVLCLKATGQQGSDPHPEFTVPSEALTKLLPQCNGEQVPPGDVRLPFTKQD